MKYKLQYIDHKCGLWATFYNYKTLEEALENCSGVSKIKKSPTRIAVEVDVVIYNNDLKEEV